MKYCNIVYSSVGVMSVPTVRHIKDHHWNYPKAKSCLEVHIWTVSKIVGKELSRKHQTRMALPFQVVPVVSEGFLYKVWETRGNLPYAEGPVMSFAGMLFSDLLEGRSNWYS